VANATLPQNLPIELLNGAETGGDASSASK
jgi:hypothetical protein